MTAEYRERELTNACKELEAARSKMEAIKVWSGKKRDAAELVEFWSNKVAFLTCTK